MAPENTFNIMEITLFQGNVENPKNHASQYLRKKRGIKGNKGGGYIAEYNFKFSRTEKTWEIGFFRQWQPRIVPCLAANKFF